MFAFEILSFIQYNTIQWFYLYNKASSPQYHFHIYILHRYNSFNLLKRENLVIVMRREESIWTMGTGCKPPTVIQNTWNINSQLGSLTPMVTFSRPFVPQCNTKTSGSETSARSFTMLCRPKWTELCTFHKWSTNNEDFEGIWKPSMTVIYVQQLYGALKNTGILTYIKYILYVLISYIHTPYFDLHNHQIACSFKLCNAAFTNSEFNSFVERPIWSVLEKHIYNQINCFLPNKNYNIADLKHLILISFTY